MFAISLTSFARVACLQGAVDGLIAAAGGSFVVALFHAGVELEGNGYGRSVVSAPQTPTEAGGGLTATEDMGIAATFTADGGDLVYDELRIYDATGRRLIASESHPDGGTIADGAPATEFQLRFTIPFQPRVTRSFADSVLDLGCKPMHLDRSAAAGDANSAKLQAWADKLKSTITGSDLYISARHRVNAKWILPNVTSGRIVFAGGLTEPKTEANYEAIGQLAGYCGALVWGGNVGPGSGAMIEDQGHGSIFEGGANLCGAFAETVFDLAPHSTKLLEKCLVVRGVGGGTGVGIGLGTGVITQPGAMLLFGFGDGITFGTGREEDNADNCRFNRIFMSHIDRLIVHNCRQTVSNTFGHIRQFADGTAAEQRAFELVTYLQGGGKTHIAHAELNGGLLCRVHRSDYNTAQMVIDSLSLDGANHKSYRIFDGNPDGNPGADNPFHLQINSIANGIYPRESSATAGPMIDAYHTQRVHISGATFLEAANGASIRTHTGPPVHVGDPAGRPEILFNGCCFDQCSPADLYDAAGSTGSKKTYGWTNCVDRNGIRIAPGNIDTI